jgi:hypothetical protein
MTDEPEVPEEEGYGGAEETAPYEVEVEGAVIVAPRGWGAFAAESGAALVRVRMAKGGDVDILVQSEDDLFRWQTVGKPDRSSLKSIKPA